MDPQTVLGLEAGATPAEIDAAYARRRRLHVPEQQPSPAERAAAERYHAELDAAYATLLRAAPASSPPVSSPPGPRPRVQKTVNADRTTSRDAWIRVGVALVACYLLVQLPFAVGLGFAGAIVGYGGAIAVAVLTWRHLRRGSA